MSSRGLIVALGVALASAGQAVAAPPPAPAAAAPATKPAAKPAAGVPAATGKSVRVGEVRRRMEQDLAEIGKIAQKARREGDMVKIACATDKEDRASTVMDVATPEMVVLQDKGADGQAKTFAADKLQAASGRLGKLLEEARACTGMPAAGGDDGTTNQVDESRNVPPRDPTAGPSSGPGAPPPIDPGRPPVTSPVQ